MPGNNVLTSRPSSKGPQTTHAPASSSSQIVHTPASSSSQIAPRQRKPEQQQQTQQQRAPQYNQQQRARTVQQGNCVQERYDIFDPIASGTYGTIHQCALTDEYAAILEECGAEEQSLTKLCAVKIQRHDPDFWDNFSFLREIDALMRTRRFPGTVDVLDCVLDTDRECAFIVMDQYDGTLLQFINQMPFDERIRHLPFVCAQLLITMAYLDRHGIAHRDIKPSNVLIQRAPVRGHRFGECGDDDRHDNSNANAEKKNGNDNDDDEDAEYDAERDNRYADANYEENDDNRAKSDGNDDDDDDDERGDGSNGKHDGKRAARAKNRSRFRDCMQLFAPLLQATKETYEKARENDEDALKRLGSKRNSNANTASRVNNTVSSTKEDSNVIKERASFLSARVDDYNNNDHYVEEDDEEGDENDVFAMDEDVCNIEKTAKKKDNDEEDDNNDDDDDDNAMLEDSQQLWKSGLLTHSNDGRPHSFPGVRCGVAPSHSASRCAQNRTKTTTDGESNTLVAGDLASLNRTPLVVICDFGLAKQLGPLRDTPCLVTLNFRPPEMFVDTHAASLSAASTAATSVAGGSANSSATAVPANEIGKNASRNDDRRENDAKTQQTFVPARYKTNIDVWSLACVLMQYVTTNLLFQGTNEYYVMRLIAQFVGAVPRDWESIGWTPSPPNAASTHAHRLQNIARTILGSTNHVEFANFDDFCDLLAQMFDPCGETRPSATDLLRHRFVAPFVHRTMRFMCSVTQRRHTYGRRQSNSAGAGASGNGCRVIGGRLRATARWAFQTGVDVATERLDVSLGLAHTPSLSAQHRELLCDWIWLQNRTLRYDAGTAIGAIHNFDRFMSHASLATLSSMNESTYSLACIVCYYLTIHYYEKYVARLETLIATCGFEYEARTMRQMIRTVLTALHFQISTPSHWTLYCRYRATMHMPQSMDSRVATLLLLLLRRVYFAASIPKSVLLSLVVERVRFNRHYEQQFGSVRLRALAPIVRSRRAQSASLVTVTASGNISSINNGRRVAAPNTIRHQSFERYHAMQTRSRAATSNNSGGGAGGSDIVVRRDSARREGGGGGGGGNRGDGGGRGCSIGNSTGSMIRESLTRKTSR